MGLLEKHSCPRCSAGSNAKHCPKSNVCSWYICTKCTGNVHSILIFKGKNFFVRGGN